MAVFCMCSSIALEFAGCDFADVRLTNRVIALADTLRQNPQESINMACGSAKQSKAAYRFFQNEKVTPQKILEPHTQQTIERAKKLTTPIIIIQDTTDLIYHFPSIQGLGRKIKSKGFIDSVKGLELHSSLAVNLDGTPVGILKQTFFTYEDIRNDRGQEKVNIARSHKLYPIEKKTSFRWVEHFLETDKVLKKENIEAVHVADRECDIYEFLQSVIQTGSKCVVRSQSDRRTHEGDKSREISTLEKKLNAACVMGQVEVKKKLKDGKVMTSICNVKSTKVLLRKPQRGSDAKSKELVNIPINVVEVKEISSVNNEKSLHWRLLTNLDCDTYESLLEIIKIYKARWNIECFHRILKSGFGVEKARLNSRERIEKLASILSVVSWHLFWLYKFSREVPQLAASLFFDMEELRILTISSKKLKVAISEPLNLQTAILIIARLGGYSVKKLNSMPGMEVMWRGWKKFYERCEFFREITYG